MRVHELATDLDVTVEELLEILSDVEIKAEDGQSLLADKEVAVVCDELGFTSIEAARAAKATKTAPAAPAPKAEVSQKETVPTLVADEEEPADEASHVLAFAKPQIAVKELAEKMALNIQQIKLVSGHHSPSKILSLPD